MPAMVKAVTITAQGSPDCRMTAPPQPQISPDRIAAAPFMRIQVRSGRRSRFRLKMAARTSRSAAATITKLHQTIMSSGCSS